MLKTLSITLMLALASSVTYAQSDEVVSPPPSADLDSLLKRVENGRKTETALHQKREQEFLQRQGEQRSLLEAAKQERIRLERVSERLEANRRENEEEIKRVAQLQAERSGQLQELFGVLQQASSDAKAVISKSHVTINSEGRLAAINDLVESTKDTSLPTIDQITVWPTQMIREMIGSGEVVKFQSEVNLVNGTTEVVDLVRVGDFGIMGDNRYFVLKDNQRIDELVKQPSGRFTSTLSALHNSQPGQLIGVGIDPTRGQLLGLEVQKPDTMERVAQGGRVGYIILVLGAFGVLMAIFQWAYLFVVGRKVSSQTRNSTPNKGNPLGRILSVYHDNKSVDVETLELKIDEAILKETPSLERFLALIKLISAVAPLFGLLGTVIGMIETFQAITLFGAGDPTIMAAGISTALMTTVLGLVVAIPTLLLHAFVAGASKSVIHVLEEQSAGIIAVHAEEEHAGAGAN